MKISRSVSFDSIITTRDEINAGKMAAKIDDMRRDDLDLSFESVSRYRETVPG